MDQTDVLLGKSATGNRDSLLTFIGADLVAARWKQWRMYFTDVQPTGIGPQRQPGMFSSSAPMAGYPKIYNIEMDPHEDLQVGALFGWTAGPMLEVVEKYMESVKKYPNPPAPDLTNFGARESLNTRDRNLRRLESSRVYAEILAKKISFDAGHGCDNSRSCPASAQQPQKPNILVIMADDIGYWNISAYNRGMMGYHTPNIDRIANDGAIFTDYYGQQSCTAGRAAFITGQSPLRTGLLKVGLPAAKEGLSEKDPTIAELLKPQGYVTGQFGKNHLGDRNEFLPTVHGFDEFFGNLYHLNAEDEPENPDYPKSPSFKAQFGPRGVMKCVATTTDTPGEDPRFGAWGKQKCEDTGPLTKKRMETIDEEFLERLDELHRSRQPRQEAVFRLVQSEPHAHLDPSQDGIPGQDRSRHLSGWHGGA